MTSILGAAGRWSIWLLVMLAALGIILGFFGPLHYDFDAISYFRPHFGVLALLGGLAAIPLSRRCVKWIGFGAALVAFTTLGPVWRIVERPAEAGEATRSVTVMTANLLMSNPTLDLTVSALLAADADILATEETPRRLLKSKSPLYDRYPYTSVRPPPYLPGSTLWSKYPLQRIDGTRPTDDTPNFISAYVDLGGGAGFGITALHLSWPLVARGAQGRQIGLIPSLLPAESGPKVLMGDFNAAPWSLAMRRVEHGTGLRMIGGLRQTWRGGYPNPIRFLRTGQLYGGEVPALLGHHIDHILLSDGIGVEAVEVIPLPGSDHRGVWAKLNIPLQVPRTLLAGG